MTTRVVILGAGFGGLELTARLADELPGDVDVTLIDKSAAFVFGFAKLDVLFGKRTLDEVRLPYSAIAKPGVQFRNETITSIDPEAKVVTTSGGRYEADVLVVALGADLAPDATPGLAECGYEFYSPEGAARVRAVLPAFEGGRVVIGVLGGVFKCPPAPFETAFMMDEWLRERGQRDRSSITIASPLPKPIPISQEVSAAILDMAGERGIEFWPQSQITHLDPATNVVHLKDGRELGFDLFLGVPVHKAPDVVLQSPLAVDGWVAVDPTDFSTRFPDVYAVGDVTNAPVPRAGVFAEGEASTVADVLIARIRGGDAPGPYHGGATCYMDTGGDKVSRVQVNFLSGPSPTAVLQPPSEEGAAEKREFAVSRARRWFGL